MISINATHEQWFQHIKSGWFNSYAMLMFEEMSRKSLTLYNALCK
jgi:hypothetical protein